MALTQVNTDGVKDDAVSLAKMAVGTDGQIITYDASGNPTAVGPGTDGQVLTSTGAGSPPAFEDAAGGVDNVTSDNYGIIVQTTNASNDSIVIVKGNEAKDAELRLYADEADDNADMWRLNASASDGTLAIQNYAGGGWENSILLYGNGAAKFYKDNTLMCETSNDGLKFPAGKGIDFSAQTVTSVTGTTASQTTEVLDHYEEGSWTPSCQTGSGGGAGQYVRIGNLVTITGYINPQDTSSSNTVHLENIPYPATSGGGTGWNGAVRGYHINDINSKRAHVSVVDTNDTVQFGTLESANAWTMLKHNNIASTNNAINFTITYRTDA